MPPAPATEKPVRPPGIDLKRHLAMRVTLFACLIGLGASAFVIDHSTRRIGEHVRLSGPTVEQLIGRELDTPRDGFDRSADGLALALPDALGRLSHGRAFDGVMAGAALRASRGVSPS